VSRFLPRCLGIDTATLALEAQRCLDAISEMPPDEVAKRLDRDAIPVISIEIREATGARPDGRAPES
jgi:hypothetical protein